MIDLIANIYAQKAALWSLYGKTEMTLISSQLLLNLNMSHPAQGVQCYNGEGTSLAVCNVINTLAEQVHLTPFYCQAVYKTYVHFLPST